MDKNAVLGEGELYNVFSQQEALRTSVAICDDG